MIARGALLVALAGAFPAPAGAAESVLYRFASTGADGRRPDAGLILDRNGVFYGATYYGGTANFGTVYKLTRPVPPATVWTKTTLHSFAGAADGANPVAALVIDNKGALYGTTSASGASGRGTVFKLTPPVPPAVAWTRTVLHSFQNGAYGVHPHAGLVFEPSSGALFGVTTAGGAGYGVVFKLTPPCGSATQWTLSAIYAFKGGVDGRNPYGDLIIDENGVIYGATSGGGASDKGLVFKLTPPVPPATVWTKATLHSFAGADGANPNAGLIRDGKGALYGTTANGGAFGYGAVFKLTPSIPSTAAWTRTVLYSFGAAPDGQRPYAGLLLDAGVLYGVTSQGGTRYRGTVFKLTPPVPPASAWTRTTLHSFNDDTDGESPRSRLIFDAAGALYGTTQFRGGASAYGVVFRVQ